MRSNSAVPYAPSEKTDRSLFQTPPPSVLRVLRLLSLPLIVTLCHRQRISLTSPSFHGSRNLSHVVTGVRLAPIIFMCSLGPGLFIRFSSPVARLSVEVRQQQSEFLLLAQVNNHVHNINYNYTNETSTTPPVLDGNKPRYASINELILAFTLRTTNDYNTMPSLL